VLCAAFSSYILALAKNAYEKCTQKNVDEIDHRLFEALRQKKINILTSLQNIFGVFQTELTGNSNLWKDVYFDYRASEDVQESQFFALDGTEVDPDRHFPLRAIYQTAEYRRLTREMTDLNFRQQIIDENPDLNPDFIFLNPAHNFRSTELNAVIGLSQIKKLDANNVNRVDNFNYFISKLDSNKYFTDYEIEGQCNYAFIIMLKEASFELRNKVESILSENGIEFRRGLSGGGNQLRQPYFKKNYSINYDDFKNTDHVHHFSWYVGNYPTLEREKINTLINILNAI
jgi:CDP-6-deoxy-D-xylo-4-hexulose-3-dehydrase